METHRVMTTHAFKSITIPRSRFNQFRYDPACGLRWGQAFYAFMQFEKVTSNANKEWCDRLYAAKDNQAKNMVRKVIDDNQ